MQALTPITPLEPGVEMFQRGKTDSLFSQTLSINIPLQRTSKPRPLSEVTEILDGDFDDGSEFEEDEEDSDDLSFEFAENENRRSQTTISTYDEVSTPASSRRGHFDLQVDIRKPVEGPKGPHLFRSSQISTDTTFDYALQLSPLLPRDSPVSAFRSPATITTVLGPNDRSSLLRVNTEIEDPTGWNAQQVAMWMYNCGFDESIVERFEHHDITGMVLLDMQFDDLKELGIQSFGKRHQLWNHICALRSSEGGISPAPTPFQDISRPCSRNTRSNSRKYNGEREERPRERDGLCEGEDGMTPITPGGRRRKTRKHRRNMDEVITPAESVSIVAIEQLLPKPHKCAKGEKCAKWKKQQRQLQKLHEEHGFPISPENGGRIFIAGDPGNAKQAVKVVDKVYRPTSEAIPSVVASSDLLGPGQMPEVALQEEALKKLEEQDPQENVKNFLTLQHINEPPDLPMQPPISSYDVDTAPMEMFPPLDSNGQPQGLQPNLTKLPKLSIPRCQSANQYLDPHSRSAVGQSALDSALSPCRTAAASPGVYRFGTPCSEMDAPVTLPPTGPVSRDTSQSVPPNMQYRDPVARSSSRTDWKRPSFAMPRLDEGEVFSPGGESFTMSPTLHGSSERSNVKTPMLEEQRMMYQLYPGANHVGWMKKRRTKLLRHEWHDQHMRLIGSQLAMHPNALPSSTPVDTLDIDEYAVACSSLASNKLSSRFKSLKIKKEEKDVSDSAAFTFQLVPQAKEGEDRSSAIKRVVGGKTHHFAVKTRDERIDWMRELMLAKALKAKNEGFEVHINGHAA